MEGIAKNFRGFFSQSSLNTLTAVVAAAAQEAQSGDIHISSRAQNFLTLGSMILGMAHLFVNANPELHSADVAPIPGAPFPGSLSGGAPAPAAEPAPAPAPEPAPAPAPAPEPAPAAPVAAAPVDGLAAVLAAATGG